MKLRVPSLCLVAVLLVLIIPSKSTAIIPNPPGPHEYVAATLAGGPQTVDPALAYDAMSGELVMQVYETLIDFNRGSASDYVPELATNWTISPDGQTYTFTIRSDVQWQDPAYGNLTPADVEYSFERVMVRDYTGGPAWMLWYPIFRTFAADMSDPVAQGIAIDNAITSDDIAGTVTIHLATGYAYAPLLSILTQTWASVLSKDWASDHGDWPGTGLQDSTWAAYHDPAMSPLDNPFAMMGTGPYKFDYYNYGAEWSIVKFDNYWGGWSNPRRGFASRGFLTRVTEIFIGDDAARLAGFLAGMYDSVFVSRGYMSQIWQQPKTRCIYPLSGMAVDALIFNYDIQPPSPCIGDGWTPGFTFNETGIRPDFFSDVHARKAIAYSFNWTQYISTVYMGEAEQNAIPVSDSLKFFNASLPKYEINITRAAEEWKLAWGGNSSSPGPVWTQGFRFQIIYNEGHIARQTLAQILKTNVEAQNPKFHIDVVAQHFGDSYVPFKQQTMYLWVWLPEYPDVDSYVWPFMTPQDSGIWIDIWPPAGPEMKHLVWLGMMSTNDADREAIYNRLWQLYIQETPSVPLTQSMNRHWEHDWVQGWYHNPASPEINFYSGGYPNYFSTSNNYYSMWKEELPTADMDANGKVEIKDLATAAKAYGAYYIQPLLPPCPVGTPGYYTSNWNSRADVVQDMKVDIKDLAAMAKEYGYIAPPWTPP